MSLHPILVSLALCGAMTALSPPIQAQSAPSQSVLAPKIQRPSLEQMRYGGMAAYRLSDGRSEAVVVPALGRVMRYGLVGGANWLWNAVPGAAKAGEWRNWGGDKSWPAPQSRWPLAIGREWPPHPSWDGEAYQATVLAKNRLRITSGIWPRFGCRVIRDFSFDESGDFVVAQSYEKLSGPPVELAIWSITQVATPDAIFTSANPQSVYKNNFHWLMKPEKPADISLAGPDVLRIRPNGGAMNKIGVDAPLAAIITVKDGLAFRQKAARPEGNYPDGAQGNGFPIEIFDFGGEGSDHYLETELLSPMRLFTVGSRWTYTVKWSLHTLQNQRLEAPESGAEIRALLGLS